jgi:hypothetical protein
METEVKTKTQCEIRYKDFTLVPDTIARDRFNLYRDAQKVNKKTKKESGYLKLVGYGYRLDEAIDQLIKEELADRSDISDLKAYVSEYKRAVSEVNNVLK